MLEDPEAESEEWSQEVWADSEEQAVRICQTIADNATKRSRTVVTVLGLPQKLGQGRKYVCRFRGETTP